jgi:hypothetical protein
MRCGLDGGSNNAAGCGGVTRWTKASASPAPEQGEKP